MKSANTHTETALSLRSAPSSPEIPGHDRFLIVLGMARSGTTIFTYVLSRHPAIRLFRGGPEAWVLENSCLLRRNVKRLGRVATLFPEATYVVLKRAWQEEHALWMRTHMPGAHYIILVRDRESIQASWRSTGRWTLGDRPDARADPNLYYDRYLEYAKSLPRIIGESQARIIRYEQLLSQPQTVFADLARWLNIPSAFDVTPIGKGLHWRRELAEEFPRGDWILDDPPSRAGR